MNKLNVHFGLVAVIFLCSVGVVQSMELEILSIESQKNKLDVTSQGRSLQKMAFFPVGPGTDQILNLISNPKILSIEMWQKIWDYLFQNDLCQKDKIDLGLLLKLSSLSHRFDRIRQVIQLDKGCRLAPNIKVPDSEIYYIEAEDYKKLQYSEEVFNESNPCNECKDQRRDNIDCSTYCIKCCNLCVRTSLEAPGYLCFSKRPDRIECFFFCCCCCCAKDCHRYLIMEDNCCVIQ